MLFYERHAGIESQGAMSSFAAVVRPGLRAYVVRAKGIRFDTAVHPAFFEKAAPKAPSKISVVLSGELVMRSDCGRERSLSPGDVCLHGPGWSERWEGSEISVMVLDWAESFGGASSVGSSSLSASDRRRLVEMANRLEAGLSSGEHAARWASDVVARLRGLGAPLERLSTDDLSGDMPDGILPIAEAVTQALCDLRQRPSWSDVETPLKTDARSLRRQVARFGPWLEPLGWPGEWRRTVRSLRLVAAVRLFGSKNATVEQVAAATGYGSARALILALHQEGFPTPSAIRAFYRGQSVQPHSL